MSNSKDEDISAVYSDYVVGRIFDEENRNLFSKIESAFDNCFMLSKENRVLEAETHLKAGERYKSLISPELQPWVTSFLGQRVSYFYYKVGNFEKAIDISNQIISSSRTLVSSGFQFMFFTEIQQRFNISRIFFAKREISAALEYNINSIQQTLERSPKWNANLFIESSSFSERDIIFDMQYKMMLSIILESYSRAIKALENNWCSLYSTLTEFTTKMERLDFEIQSGYYDCKDFSIFLKIVKYFFENGAESVDDTGADFLQSKHTDKRLLKILYELAKIISYNTRKV
jgi:hypothetical protein